MRIGTLVQSAILAVAAAKPLEVDLKTDWSAVPLYAHTLETVALHNATAYFPLLSLFLSHEDANGKFISEQEAVDFVLEKATLKGFIGKETLPLVEAELANSHRAAYVQAQCQHFETAVVPEYGQDLLECNNVLLYNGKATCDPVDVFALETTASHGEPPVDLLETDKIIGGGGAEVPWAVLYADFASEEFPTFHAHLLASALEQKISYVLRYKPSKTGNPSAQIGGYGVTVQVKRTDYLVVDDRPTKGEKAAELKLDLDPSKIDKRDIPRLDLRAASYILDSENPFDALVDTTLDFPGKLAEIKDQPVNEELVEDLRLNDAKQYFGGGTNVILANGAPVFVAERSVYNLLDALRREQAVISQLEDLGLSTETAKSLLLGGVVVGTPEDVSNEVIPRYDVRSDAIIWLNNVEKDPNFGDWSKKAKALLEDVPLGQFPVVRRNINSLVLSIDLTSSSALQMLGQLLSMVARKAPVQVGIVPATTTPASEALVQLITETGSSMARQVYIVGLLRGLSPQEAYEQALEAQKADRKPGKPLDLTIKEVWEQIMDWHERLDVFQPAIFVNGRPLAFTQDWLYEAASLFSTDLELVKSWVAEGTIAEDDTTTSLRDELFKLGEQTRSDIVDPINVSRVKYIDATKSEQVLQGFLPKWTTNSSHTVWYAADFTREDAYEQLVTLLELAAQGKFSLSVIPLITRGLSPEEAQALASLVRLSGVEPAAAAKGADMIMKWQLHGGEQPSFVPDEETAAVAAAQLTAVLPIAGGEFFDGIPPGALNFNVDGRLLSVEQPLSESVIEQLVARESPRVDRIVAAVEKTGFDKNPSAIVSLLTAAWFAPEMSRLVSSNWGGAERTVSYKASGDAKIDVTAVVDPASEIGQELVAYLDLIRSLDIADIRVFLSPRELPADGAIPNRYYQGVFPRKISFDKSGYREAPAAKFEQLKDDVLYVVGIDEPNAWVVMAHDCDYDLDNVVLNSVSEPALTASYSLESILLEGHASEVSGRAPQGAQLVLGTPSQPHISDTMVMANLGYFQFQANPGFWTVELEKGASNDIYQFAVPAGRGSKLTVWLTDMTGHTIRPKLARRAGKETANVLEALPSAQKVPKGKKSGWFSDKLGQLGLGKAKDEQADINIFTVASGHLYERFLSIMTLSVMRHTEHTVKFWLIEDFLSPSFKKFLPSLAEKYGFKYELVTYKWPSWLRGQSEKQREIWGYKILFLDVLFPQGLDKVIFVDSDQIVRTDMIELVNEDLQGAPYGYTPMGDDREEMEGFRFWKQGYWKDYLRGAPYHISALYVVDLDRFRQTGAGDLLRQHYQQLSADPKSLSNLDQDLPNNLQFVVPIHSLDKDWLWCETWCSDEGLSTAKTIDLCNNPLTKEPKLDRARRQIPEWVEYDDAVAALRQEVVAEAEQAEHAALLRADEQAAAATGATEDDHDEL